MINFIIIFFCIVSGVLLKKYKYLPQDSHKSVNAWLINIALPAFALKYIPKIEWSTELILPLSMPLVVWIGSYLFINLIAKKYAMTRATKTALILVSGLGNTSFLGFPLTQAYFENGLQVAVLCDQACFIITSTFGIIIALKASQETKVKPLFLVRKVFSFPPFVVSLIALITAPFIDYSPMEEFLNIIGATLVPLALFSVGLQLNIKNWRTDIRLISLSLLYKLMIAPSVILLLSLLMQSSGLIKQVTIFEAAMAPMVTAAIIAADYNLNPKLANMILGLGIPISLITTFIWSLII
ncbi:AEC family transporter [Neptunitalea lumnitzerae]|uniref:Transporter n=1 Tax=Neptunitalea lumnitzerae TaxID=2965509 RepID=A0ABQ5MII1_9FLAO|nr:AEC family transporter [Neptunitalea sp. Y10]GLB49231.1 transporter [Neptunitalea sp. Y10]